MRRQNTRALASALAFSFFVSSVSPVWAAGRGGGGARGGGGPRGSGGMAHSPGVNFSGARPNFGGNAMSRPNIGGNTMSRPNVGGNTINRPNVGGNVVNRPNVGGNTINRPNVGGNTINRPNIGGNTINRPNIGGNTVNRPNISGNTINRPNFGGNTINRPNISGNTINRPNFGGNTINRPNFGGNTINRPNFGNNVNVNNTVVNNVTNYNRPVNINGGYRPGYRPGYGGGGNWGYRPGYGGGGNWGYRPGWGYHQSWVNGYWHGHWNRSNWNWGSFALGTAVGGLAGWGFGSTLWNWGYTPYVNPYYAVAATPIVVQQPVVVQEQPVVVQQPLVAPYDYSQPINTQGAPPPEDVSNPAVTAFDEARSAFKQGDYARALALTDQSLKTLPNDATAHEFRALCLFALKNYPQAAGPLYAVLSVGPGWDWTTMIGLYPEAETYTQQLRALEDFVRANPTSAPAHFVLAYHYLTQGHNDAAVGQFKEVVKLQPDDKLSAGLVAAFTPQDTTTASTAASPAAPAEQPPATPQPEERASKIPAPAADAVVGTWKAMPEPDVTIALTLQPESKFKWDVTQKGKTQSFDGEYTYGGDTMSLVQSAGPAMVGKLTWTDKDHVNFKIAGGPPQDPGLNFAR